MRRRAAIDSWRILAVEALCTLRVRGHTDQGEMFREVLVWAATASNLPVIGIREKELVRALAESHRET